MANNFITPQFIAQEMAMLLSENLVAGSLFSRGLQSEFGPAKVGDTVKVIVPASFSQNTFTGTTSYQDATESEIDVVVDTHLDVSFSMTTAQMSLELDEFSNRLIAPAANAHARGLDAFLLDIYKEVGNYFGTAADPPDAFGDVVDMVKEADDLLMPPENRVAIVGSAEKADLLKITQFTDADKRGDGGSALRRAELGEVLGIRWFMDQNRKSHTAGTQTGHLVNGTPAAGATTIPVDTGTGTFVVGDLITFATTPGEYTITAAYAGGAGNISIYPGLSATGTDNEAITTVATHAANLLFDPRAFTYVIVPPALPRGAAEAAIVNIPGVGGVRVIFDWDNDTKADRVSIDFLVGKKRINHDYALRVLG